MQDDPGPSALPPRAAPSLRPPTPPDGVENVAVVGAGLIGSRWTALFIANGINVNVVDSAPDCEERVRSILPRCLSALSRLGVGRGSSGGHGGGEEGSTGTLSFVRHPEEAVASADFVQESVADDEALKVEVIRRIDEVSRPSVIIASSTSGILPTVLQSGCRHPERVVVGHPFNPVHLIPLIEVVPGTFTCPDVLERTMTLYRRLDKWPLLVRREAPGFVANRIQEAVWREMFHLVNDDVATTGEIDAAVANGPGLRWALLGPAFIYLMQGGSGGIAHALEQFDPSRISEWSHNTYPPLTPRLEALLDEQTKEQAGSRSLEEWEALRDEFLLRVLEVKRELFDCW